MAGDENGEFDQVVVWYGLKSLFFEIFCPNLAHIKLIYCSQSVPNYSFLASLEVLENWIGNVKFGKPANREIWGGNSNFPSVGKWHLAFGEQSDTLWREIRCTVKTYLHFCLLLTSCIKAWPGGFVPLSVF